MSQRTRRPLLSAFTLFAALLPPAIVWGQSPAGSTSTAAIAAKTLSPAITLPNALTNGVAIAPGGRTFLVIAKQKGQDVPQLAEYSNGQLKPYPDASWNQWKKGDDPARAFVHANSVRFGPDGTLWVVDFGSTELGEPIVKHGPKLVAINIATGQVVNVVYFDNLTKPQSAIDDIRFNGQYAYLTDAGWPGIIVLHMPDAAMYRVLSDQPSTSAQKPLRAEGHQLQDKHGKPIYFHADQLEVSPDGKTLYWQPNTGPMYAIETQYLDNPALQDSERAKHVRLFLDNGTAGGTAIDARGNIYVSDCDHNAVLKVSPEGKAETLVQDPRLVWVDAMWITPDGRLWMPAAQIDRTPSFDDGKNEVHYPMQVFTVHIGNGPPVSDHR